MSHTHTVTRESVARGCKDNVGWIQFCSCGCERQYCNCTQCYGNRNNSHSGRWYMPVCSACGQCHPIDTTCIR